MSSVSETIESINVLQNCNCSKCNCSKCNCSKCNCSNCSCCENDGNGGVCMACNSIDCICNNQVCTMCYKSRCKCSNDDSEKYETKICSLNKITEFVSKKIKYVVALAIIGFGFYTTKTYFCSSK